MLKVLMLGQWLIFLPHNCNFSLFTDFVLKYEFVISSNQSHWIRCFTVLTSFGSERLGLLTDVGLLPGSYFSIHLGSRRIIPSGRVRFLSLDFGRSTDRRTSGPSALGKHHRNWWETVASMSQLLFLFISNLCLKLKWLITPPQKKHTLIYEIINSI